MSRCNVRRRRIGWPSYRLNELSARELRALLLVEAGVAIGWIASRWPGLLTELAPSAARSRGRRRATLDAQEMLTRGRRTGADRLSRWTCDPLLGTLPLAYTMPQGLADKLRRSFGRMPWTTTQKRLPRPYSVPVGGDGGVRNPNLPPPNRPQDNDLDITPEHRPGIPYPEWNMWTERFMPDHVAVLERVDTHSTRQPVPVAADLRKWFDEHTHRAMTDRLEDGSRPRRRAVRQPLHRPDHRRGDRTAHLPRAAAQQSRRHHRIAARRQLVARACTAAGSSGSSWPVPTRFPAR